MIKTLIPGNDQLPVWLDIENPEPEELENIAAQLGLHPLTVQDSLQPDHLPKFESQEEDNAFVILRYYDGSCPDHADTMQAVSNKIAIFISPTFILTVHRKPSKIISEVSTHLQQWSEQTHKSWTTWQALGRVMREVLFSFGPQAHNLDEKVGYYESRIFLRNNNPDLLQSIYLLKRRASILRRLLTLLNEPVNEFRIQARNQHPQLAQDIKDHLVEMETLFDQLNEEMNQLLSLYISLSSQRTNEVMRILTIFSVFFLPLTFIVGVYGMNFQFMPELSWKYGYALVWIGMIAVTFFVWRWFKKRKWL
jgi:magnesium transporter